MTCVYLGDGNASGTHACQLFGECRLTGVDSSMPVCESCAFKLTLKSPTFAQDWVDPLTLYTARGEETAAIRNLLAGRAVFLACGGPSLNNLPLERLNERGMWTMAVNNTAGHPRFRSQAMVIHDPPIKFSHSIWLDPAIMKFAPSPKVICRGRGMMRQKVGGKFDNMVDGKQMSICDAPNVWGYKRRKWMRPDVSFFLDEELSLGNFDLGVAKTGENKTICTMLAAMRLLRYLGASKVFMIGVDFRMVPDQRYAFPDSRGKDDAGERAGLAKENNHQFKVVNDWLCRMQAAGVFKLFGIQFFNCLRTSGLRAFPYIDFETAANIVQGSVEKTPDLDMWYKKD